MAQPHKRIKKRKESSGKKRKIGRALDLIRMPILHRMKKLRENSKSQLVRLQRNK
jgi:hypothetical protein